jgi:site-specific recombinase XerD
MILLAYRHGLRTSEVCTLKLDDVSHGSLSVQRVKGCLKTVQPLEGHPSEPLLDEVAAIKKWLKERPSNDSRFLFTSRKGGAVHKTQFFRIFQAIAEKAGVPAPKRHPRILKYSLAAHLLSRNVDLALLHHVLGHRSIDTTLRYIKTTDQQAASAVREAITEIF